MKSDKAAKEQPHSNLVAHGVLATGSPRARRLAGPVLDDLVEHGGRLGNRRRWMDRSINPLHLTSLGLGDLDLEIPWRWGWMAAAEGVEAGSAGQRRCAEGGGGGEVSWRIRLLIWGRERERRRGVKWGGRQGRQGRQRGVGGGVSRPNGEEEEEEDQME